MKKIILLSLCIFSMSLFAQKTTKKPTDTYTPQFTAYINTTPQYLVTNKLTSSQMKKMMQDTFRAIADDADFVSATDKYFSTQYDKDIVDILKPYYIDQLTVQQLDTLISIAKDDNVKHAIEGLALCADADYRQQKLDEMLNATVTAKNDKAKAKAIKKIKKNMSKYQSDCTDEYRKALAVYSALTGTDISSEELVNAIYHTVTLDQLNAYNAALSSQAFLTQRQVESSITDNIYTVQAECVSHFQTWTYKAYPSIFTKKQAAPKKRKGKKGKKSNSKQQDTQQTNDTIIEGGLYY